MPSIGVELTRLGVFPVVGTTVFSARGEDEPGGPFHDREGKAHFQDAGWLVQRLVELEKDFDVMIHRLERHNFSHSPGRYPYTLAWPSPSAHARRP